MVNFLSEGGVFVLEKLQRRKRSAHILQIPIASIDPNPAQPRKTFRKAELLELSASIRENGVLQPITIRKGNGSRYELIAGERRLRASALAGLTEIPCILVEMDEKQSSLIALMENLQRCDLDFIEEAIGIYNLIQTYGFSQEEAAKKLGKSQSAISNKLRILRMDAEVLQQVIDGELSERHARALLRLGEKEEQLRAIREIVRRGLTVSETDNMIEQWLIAKNSKPPKKPETTYVFKDLRLFLNTINHAVDTMRHSGIRADLNRVEDDTSICMTIRILKSR